MGSWKTFCALLLATVVVSQALVPLKVMTHPLLHLGMNVLCSVLAQL